MSESSGVWYRPFMGSSPLGDPVPFHLQFSDFVILPPPFDAPDRQHLDFASLMALNFGRGVLMVSGEVWDRMGLVYRREWAE